MTPINFHKKEKPLTSLVSMGGGAAGMAHAGGVDKTYLDDVFSTYVYRGNDSNRTITNGLDLSTEGGMVWSKCRVGSSAMTHLIYDTERGVTKDLAPNGSGVEGTSTTMVTAFNTDGYNLGTSGYTNENNSTFASWSFRKAKGFFDIKTWDGNGSAGRQISHDLGCVPGLIMVKSRNNSGDWMVYHRQVNSAAGTAAATAASYRLKLNENDNNGTTSSWNDTTPTSTYVQLGSNTGVNAAGTSYIGYFFAGGESTAATATSCNFLGASSDDQDNKIWVGNASDKTSDFVYGTGDFTMEAWFNPVDSSNAYKRIIHHGHEWNQNNTIGLMWDHVSHRKKITFWSYALNSGAPILTSSAHAFQGSWNHVAITRSSGTFRLFLNGVLESTNTSYSASIEGSETSNYVTIGATHNLNQQECFRGNISNVRIVKGTAVYTSSFRPSYEPLTNITNTKLLCCNGSTTTSATVTPKTLVSDSTVTINTYNSPFDDPEGFKFGEEENENLIKTGSYIGWGGGGSGSHVDVDLGWEPQWVIVKNASATSSWTMFDSMRGTPTGRPSQELTANTTNAENNYNINQLDFTSRGFRINIEGNSEMNQADSTHVYIAIRRPDGYVQKPASVGTDVFAMDTGNGSGYIPSFDSGFPVALGLLRQPSTTESWHSIARLTGTEYMFTDTTATASPYANFTMDSNLGWSKGSEASTYQSWMWKRHVGFDVVTYEGNGVGGGRQISHSMNKAPEMIWVKNRDSTTDWNVYHKGLDGGTNPEQKYLVLNTDAVEADNVNRWNDTAPTSTVFTIGDSGRVNTNAHSYIAMLFASVDGISKVGYYDGADADFTVTTGFAPRFVIIKRVNQAENWVVLDTTRGWGPGAENDAALFLDTTSAQNSNLPLGYPTSNGFNVYSGNGWVGANGGKFIYYAHA